MSDLFQTSFVFTDRVTRSEYLWKKYHPILKNRILDVGSWKNCLKPFLPPDAYYVGIDLDTVHGAPSCVVNLEKGGLPFRNDAFDCILCIDVLEHLDNLHEVLDEICRVSKRYAILSLPNPLGDLYYTLCQGHAYQPKYYTLTQQQHDRHKWFFSSRDAEAFIRQAAKKNGMDIRQMDFSHNNVEEGFGWQGFLRRQARNFLFRHSPEIPYLYRGTMWVVLEKK